MACLKGSLFEKKDLKGDKTVVLAKECSALVQNELPRKMPDPGSFQILCTTGKITLDKALYDLHLSLNVIPSSVMKKLGIQEAQATRITLQMNDQSLRQAHEPVENVLVKVGELCFPAGFDMGEDANDSIILGTSLLATKRALIDVEQGKKALRLHEVWMVFEVFNPPLPSDKGSTCIKDSAFKPPPLDGTNSTPYHQT
ncbi:uncharacterized protein LOC110265038 [Arachis ipaensis]|uniref:uncharacterized protein LOC110265038 n=1 Tax=Arachis ipaensis TaxID=130454 RepID=UPI000A2B3DEB|nr:uncharacterized protein LOC110265038 [Arachis ipaensis]